MDGERRSGRGPLLGGLALAVVVGGVAMAVALHGRPTAQRPAPTPTAGAPSLPPLPTGGPLRPAPVGDGTALAWDTTHLDLVAYDGATVATFDGTWHTHTLGATGPRRPGVLVDAPALHGVLLVTPGAGNSWLWDGSQWKPLASGAFESCMAPSSGAWDPVDNQLVVVMSPQSSGTPCGTQSVTWIFDGQVWRGFGAAPAGVLWPAVAWDAGANRVVMLQATSLAAPGMQEWSWTGRGWVAASTDKAGPQPAQFAGAAFDATAGGVVAVPTAAGPPIGYVVRDGVWTALPAATFPRRIVAVTEDGTDHAIVLLAEAPVSVTATPVPGGGADYLLTWGQGGWVAR